MAAKTYLRDLQRLKTQADALDEGPEKTAVLEEAVRLADRHNDTDEGFDCRLLLIRETWFTDRSGDLLLVHYPWCLAQFDRAPAGRDERYLLWLYKWVAASTRGRPEIPLAQLEDLLADMEARYTRFGVGRRVVAQKRCHLARHRGNAVLAEHYFKIFRDEPRDDLSDCPACETNDTVNQFLFRGRPAQALKAAEPILSGKLTCRVVPRNTLAALLLPAFKAGDDAAAIGYYKRCVAAFRRDAPPPSIAADLIDFLSLTGNVAAAGKLVAKHAVRADNYPEQDSRFGFFLAVQLFAEAHLRHGPKNINLRAGPGHPLSEKNLAPGFVRDWAGDAAKAIAARFDARNGTDAFARRAKAHGKLRNRIRPVPLD